MSPPAQRPPLRVFVGVGLVAACTLALQVLLTRVLANVLLYHFGFLAISLALLGVGGGAIAVYVRPGWFDGIALERQLARWSLAFAGLLAAAAFVIVRLDYVYTGVNTRFALTLAAVCALAALPFLAGGLVIALAVRGYAKSIGTLYAFDLAGAGLGAALVVPLLWVFVPAPTLVVGVAGLGAWRRCCSRGRRRPNARGPSPARVRRSCWWCSQPRPVCTDLKPPGPEPLADRWTPISRVLGYGPSGSRRAGS